jgi:D-glycero-D-manno-heptose 1,7-bisphosphate phosphatase
MKREAGRKRTAVFLDRDGTLIPDMGYLNQISQVRLFPGTARALKLLHRAGFYLFVVTNQSGVARGYFPESLVKQANRKVQSLLKAKDAGVERFFYCPHHPQGKVKSLRKACSCRKPKPGMVRQAAQRYPLDLKRSYVVGDKIDDLLLARNAKVAGGILVRTGNGRKSEKKLISAGLKGTVVVSNILKAAKWILAAEETK